MSDGANPTEPNSGSTPAAPVATPPVETEKVTLSKEEHDQLARDAARARTNQSKADRYDRMIGKAKGGHFKPTVPAEPPSEEELNERANAEDRKAERGLMAIASDPEFRDVLDADPTLRNLLVKNPLAVLGTLDEEPLDAEDAISLVKDQLLKRKTAKTPAAPAAPETPFTPSAPPAGAVNTAELPTDADYEAARGNKNTERAIADMISIKAKRMAGKK